MLWVDRRFAAPTDRKLIEPSSRFAIVLTRVVKMFLAEKVDPVMQIVGRFLSSLVLCLVKMSAVALLIKTREQRIDCRAHIAYYANIDWGPSPNDFTSLIDLGDPYRVAARIELSVREIRS